MSRRTFKATLGQEDRGKGATYKPGEHPYDLGLVHEIVERCERVFLGEHDELVGFIGTSVPKQLDYIEHFDHDAFLEAIVLDWQQNVDYNNLNFALTKSIKALHGVGLDTFTLDFRTVPEQLYAMFSRLKGTEEQKINITCKGNFRQFGSEVEHCNLELSDYVESFAQGAKFSTLRFSGPPEVQFSAGWGAEDSAYYLPSMERLPFTVDMGFQYLYFNSMNRYHSGHNVHEFPPLSDRCRFYVEQFDEKLFSKIENLGFWRHKNRLYVPNGKGGWNERIPEDDGWKEVPEE